MSFITKICMSFHFNITIERQKLSIQFAEGERICSWSIGKVMRFMPSYRLEPRNPLNREQCEKILKTVMDKSLEDFLYSSRQAEDLTAHISEEIKNRVKMKNYDRYRFICVVTIGEKCMQGFKSVATFLWDGDKDGYINYVYDNPDFFANATLYYLYYD